MPINLLLCVSSHCPSSSKYLSPSLWFSLVYPHASCWQWGHLLMPWDAIAYHELTTVTGHQHPFLTAIFLPLLLLWLRRGSLDKLPCCFPPDLALKFSVTMKPKESFTTVGHLLWPLSVTLTNFLVLIIFLCSPICQSVCIHWVCLISLYSINSLEQRFLVGFTVRYPKYKNNNNNSKESERRLAQHASPTNRRFIVFVVLFITKTPLTERVCCRTTDLCFLYHSMKLLWRFVWWTEFFPSSSKDCSMCFNHRFPQKDQ